MKASLERLRAMAKHLLKADEEDWQWSADLNMRIYTGLSLEDKYKLQEILNGTHQDSSSLLVCD